MEINNANKKITLTNNGDCIRLKPIVCPICSNKKEDLITNSINGQETNAWFCLKCGGLINWIK